MTGRPPATASAPVRLRAADTRVTCDPSRGFAITALEDATTGADALWRRPGPLPPLPPALGPGGAASVASFLDPFAGGWFDMVPTVGFPLDDDPSSLLHGEACRSRWTVDGQGPDHVEATLELVRTPLRLRKRVALDADGLLRIDLTLRNRGAMAVDYAIGTHPCFSRETFAGGTIELDALRAEVPAPPLAPDHHRLAPGTRFGWPIAPATDGGTIDVARIPTTPTGTTDHVCLRPATGTYTLTAPATGRALTVTFPLETLDAVLLWQDFRAPSGYPFWGDADVFALEPSSNPGRTSQDLLDAGATRRLEPGQQVAVAITARWHDWTPAPGER